MAVAGTGTASRIDDLSFTNQQTSGISLSGCVFGVIDHNTFSGNHKQGIIVNHATCGGDSYGDYNWSIPENLGTANALYIETNTFTDPNAVGAGAMDNFGGSRVVFRYNTASFIVGHGTESSDRTRGMRAFEVYNNTFTAVESSQFAGFYVRSGTGVVYNNNFVDSGPNYYNGYTNLINDRDADAFSPWGAPAGSGNPGACDGTGPYDNNAGVVYASGTASASSTTNSLVANGAPGWTTNQWVGPYAIRNVTQGWGSIISSNTASGIININSAYGQNRSWNSGDSFQVLSVYPCLDQVGRGAGLLLSGATPTPTGWVGEASEPVYAWNNTHNGVSNSAPVSSNSTRIVAGRDYFDNTPMPGYTPYVYPHPLAGGGVVATPTFSPAGGGYTGSQSVAISTVTAGATICYRTDGGVPVESGNVCTAPSLTYSAPITVSTSKTLTALGTLSGSTDSAVATAIYYIGVAPAPGMFAGYVGNLSGSQGVIR